MRPSNLFIWPLIVTLAVACSRKVETVEDVNIQSKPTAFEGNWVSKCELDKSPLLPPGEYVQKFYIIEGQNYTLIRRNFEPAREGETQCAPHRLAYSVQETGVFALKINTTGLMLSDDWENWAPGNWGTFTTEGRSIGMTPTSPNTVMLWNSNKVCVGKSDTDGNNEWKVGKTRPVSNRFCFGVKMFDTVSETLALRLDNNQDGKVSMTFGVLPDNSSDPIFPPELRFDRIQNLPFSFNKTNKKNTHFVKGKKRE